MTRTAWTPRRLAFVAAILIGIAAPLWLLLRVADLTREPQREALAPGPPAAGDERRPELAPDSSPPRDARRRSETRLDPNPDAPSPNRLETAPTSSPEDLRFEAEFGAPSPALIRQAFESALAESFSDRRLSSDEVEKASSALHRLREARIEMRALAMDPENANERRRLIEEMNEATLDFEDVMEMDPAEFTEAAQESQGGVGIDREFEPDYVPDDDFLEPRP